MSEGLERLLPALLYHLSGDLNETLISHTEEEEEQQQQQQQKEWREKSQCQSHSTSGPHPIIEGVNNSRVNVSRSGESDQRWRRCIQLWRGLLESDRLFLALLFHSGSLWAVEWAPTDPELSEATANNLGKGRCSWSESVMWFLQIHEEVTAPVNEQSGNSRSAKSTSGVSKEAGGSSLLSSSSSAAHMFSEDEAAVKHAATVLLSEWFTVVDQCGKRFARAYYFSCALKIAALAGNSALIEEIPHLHNLVIKQPRFASLHYSFCSILCALLVEEVQQQESSRLLLPPPFFLLNFNLIGRGSRIGVWLPRATAVKGNTKRSARSSDAGRGGGGDRPASGISETSEDGEFYSCQVCSTGVILGVPPSSSVAPPLSSVGEGDLQLGVQLLDEVGVRTIDLLPVLYKAGETGGATHVQEKRGRERRQSAAGTKAVKRLPQPRCWSAFSSTTKSYVRVDFLHPRELSVIVPSPSPPSGGPGKRRGPPPPQDVPINTAPLYRNSHKTTPRDPIATIVFALAIAARRLIGCRGLFVQSEIASHTTQPASDTSQTVGKGEASNGTPKSKAMRHMRHDGSDITSYNFTADGGRSTTSTNTGGGAFYTPKEELDCIVECALHLFLLALLLCHALPSELMQQLYGWTVEIISAMVDLALAASQPFVRHLRAVGFALCLCPQPHQSLLVGVGLFATLAQRQRHEGRGSSGWWEVFKTQVLKNMVIAEELPDGFRVLIERVERSFRGTPSARHAKQQRSVTEAVDASRTRQVVHVAAGAKTKDDAAAVPRPLLRFRRGPGAGGCEKEQRREGESVPTWLRPPPSVVVVPTEGGQRQNMTLNEVVMNLWWYLEQTTTNVA